MPFSSSSASLGTHFLASSHHDGDQSRQFFVWNEDCVSGARRHLSDDSIDLIVTDPPYGIQGHLLDKHYNRDESNVVDGYVEVPEHAYAEFTRQWMAEAARVLRPNGSMYVVSGWTRLADVLAAAESAGLHTVNHIIWKYNFGVFTKKKYVSSHYHILLFTKKRRGSKAKPFVFNMHCRFEGTKDAYHDMQDVWLINREYQPGKEKNKNQLPSALVEKMILYSSNPGDSVCDFFLGGFTTAIAAQRLGRVPVGFELNGKAFKAFSKKLEGAQ